MAENKKSIIVYADWQSVFNELDNEEAGQLIKHFFAYVNDENPIAPNKLIKIAFEPIKLSLKRDLQKWETSKQDKSLNGRMGNLKRWNLDLYNNVVLEKITIEEAENIAKHRKTSLPDETVSHRVANIAVNDSVNDSVSVNDILLEKETKEKFSFKSEFLNLGVEIEILDDWLEVRKKKKATNTKTAFNLMKSEIEKSGKPPNECIKICAQNSWKGFKAEWLQNTSTQIIQKNGINQNGKLTAAEKLERLKQDFSNRIDESVKGFGV